MAKNRTVSVSIALLLTLLISGLMATLPSASAHSPPWSVPTYAYLTVIPNPIGVGQTAYVTMWIDKAPPTSSNVYGDIWHNYTLKITKPDGTIQTNGPFNSDKVGGYAYLYTPDRTGVYSFEFIFGGDTVRGENPPPTGTVNKEYVGDYYLPSTARATLNVTQEQVPSYPSNQLPKGYWQRPISAVNTEWSVLGGNWLGLVATQLQTGAYNNAQNFNPYTTAPNTAHVVWTKQLAFGGQIGGEFGGTEESNYYSTSHNEPKFEPVIINGVLYYTRYPGSVTSPEGWEAVDLRTGETLWVQNISAPLRMGQVLAFKSFDQYGGTPYLWGFSGTTYSMYSAQTGNWICNIVKGVAMTVTEAADGTLIGYYVNSTSKSLVMWNSTKCIMDYGNATGQNTRPSRWRPPQGANVDFSYGIQWSVPLATSISGTPISPALAIVLVDSDVVLLTNAGMTVWQTGTVAQAGYSATTGQQLWLVNRAEEPFTRLMTFPAANGVYTEYTYETGCWSAYSIKTGQQLWGPTTQYIDDPFASYAANGLIAYGKLYALGLGGYIYAYDINTGTRLWTFSTGSSGYETIYGTYPLWVAYNLMSTVADGKIFVGGGHEYSPPMFKGSQLYAINCTTGEKVWSVLGFFVTTAPAIADGYMVSFNSYDNLLYCFGKGQTATSVSAYPTTLPKGRAVTIQGTVTDQSSGETCLGIPAAGTPAIADDDMSAWMEYLYMQQPKPTDAKGVPVHLTAVDPNGNTQDIGTVTTDANGVYGIMWTPPVEGVYKITASFGGSESYFASSAVTVIGVEAQVAAQVAAPEPTTTQTPPLTTPTTPPAVSPAPSASASVSPTQAPNPAIEAPNTALFIAVAAVSVAVVVTAVAFVLRRRKTNQQ
ncbi:MAG: PQQ-binding-like beta-propeller repeat protein [Candidatus Bathyarchaeia archaeon]